MTLTKAALREIRDTATSLLNHVEKYDNYEQWLIADEVFGPSVYELVDQLVRDAESICFDTGLLASMLTSEVEECFDVACLNRGVDRSLASPSFNSAHGWAVVRGSHWLNAIYSAICEFRLQDPQFDGREWLDCMTNPFRWSEIGDYLHSLPADLLSEFLAEACHCLSFRLAEIPQNLISMIRREATAAIADAPPDQDVVKVDSTQSAVSTDHPADAEVEPVANPSDAYPWPEYYERDRKIWDNIVGTSGTQLELVVEAGKTLSMSTKHAKNIALRWAVFHAFEKTRNLRGEFAITEQQRAATQRKIDDAMRRQNRN